MRIRRALGVGIALALALAAAAPAAALPGRNGLLAASSEARGFNKATIYIGGAHGDGTRAMPSPCPAAAMLSPAESCFAGAPAWSPDGRKIAFSVSGASPPQVYVVEAGGTGLTAVPGAQGYDPSWSPDGSRLVFSVDDPSDDCGLQRQLFTIAPDGTDKQQLTRRGGDQPDWSLRGEIAFVRRQYLANPGSGDECAYSSRIDVVRPGGRARRVKSALGSQPSWSPHGSDIAFVGRRGLYRIRANGRGLHHLPVHSLFLGELAWSPDGRLIAIRDTDHIAAVSARTGKRVRMGFDPPGVEFEPAWQRLPR